ncbi:dTDP-glucose 4,6-dehydratase [Desulfohalobiaceae bacterium Ax17]|jgi:dTDP-glucose 4,6-dehydratase|uniref:dTDP-glucose 4,6-dehydratase n=1 Tax=Desulfovulcanus ferrireducens TaxID=2831190 RepID=UPI00207BBBD1|nr:dTDP-glucose 4,6-dehydratase [Desulfovulcanus ferrireducens]MBT8763588.1 dTDP-glucose 4,6-dehydratase [Desulfovulcanus ferrireducens]
MNILVTGGCGFIGSNFIYYLFEHYSDVKVINLDKLTYAGNLKNLVPIEKKYGDKRYFFIRGCIADRELVPQILKKFQIDAVINFAAESHVDRSINDPAPFITTNINGTQNLLEASRQAGIKRFIQVSTDEVYGSLGPEGLFSEETPLAPNSPYSASKAAADLLARAYYKTYGFPVIITRCSNNYGPFQFPEKLIPLAFLKARQDEPIPIYGDGQNVRDWIYVLDHCQGVDLALQKGEIGRVYNFGGNAEKPNLEVVKAILDFLGKPHTLLKFVQDRPGHDRRYAMDFSLASRELGFKPSVDFKKGLELTLNWYLKHQDWISEVQSGEYQNFMRNWYKDRT